MYVYSNGLYDDFDSSHPVNPRRSKSETLKTRVVRKHLYTHVLKQPISSKMERPISFKVCDYLTPQFIV